MAIDGNYYREVFHFHAADGLGAEILVADYFGGFDTAGNEGAGAADCSKKVDTTMSNYAFYSKIENLVLRARSEAIGSAYLIFFATGFVFTRCYLIKISTVKLAVSPALPAAS